MSSRAALLSSCLRRADDTEADWSELASADPTEARCAEVDKIF
jgi:hypothetical protein